MDKEWTYETIYKECQGLGEDEVERKLEENAWFGGREIAALKCSKRASVIGPPRKPKRYARRPLRPAR